VLLLRIEIAESGVPLMFNATSIRVTVAWPVAVYSVNVSSAAVWPWSRFPPDGSPLPFPIVRAPS